MIGRTNTGSGGGGGLNFKIVGGTATPSNPKENTIWARTTTPIPSWVFSPAAPSTPVSGMLWIQTCDSSKREFNARKKNGIVICPLYCWQYLSGKWVELTAMSYQNGAWQNWFTFLYNRGNECTSVTGGWNGYAYKTSSSGSTTSSPTVTKGTETIKVSLDASSSRAGALFTEKPIDLTNFSTLEIDVRDMSTAENTVFIGFTADKKNNYSPTARRAILSAGKTKMDVSEYTGTYYVFVSLQGDKKMHIEFEKIRLS
jgi:hypothetical protein